VPDVTGRVPALYLPLVALVMTHRRWGWYAASVGAFLFPFLVFTNLYVVHNYYAYANGIFLLAAAAWAIEGLLAGGPLYRMVGYGLFGSCLGLAIYGYYRPGPAFDFPLYPGATFQGYHWEQANNDLAARRLGATVAAATRPDDIVVGLGLDWSAELPFYAERRALMIPNWTPRDFEASMVKDSLADLASARVGALVSCSAASAEASFAVQMAERLGLDPIPRPAEWCAMFTARRPPAERLPSSPGADPR
jgi:hypothetical protein